MTERMHADCHSARSNSGLKINACSTQQVGSGKGSPEGWQGCRRLGTLGSGGATERPHSFSI